MKKLEKGNMRISPSGMHDQMMFFIISGVGIDVFYIYAYISYFKPPTPIALDVVIFWIFGLIFNAVVFTMIIALYEQNTVEDITKHDGDIDATSKCLENIINECREKKQKAICFVTGVPGVGSSCPATL